MSGCELATGQALVERHGGVARLTEFELLGRVWTLLPEVFAPIHTKSTELFSTWLPYPVGGSVLEIGSGTGVTAVTAALRGCASVVAADISAAAVQNTGANVSRHGVGDRVRFLHSDLFEAIDPAERFDLIFWNSNVIEAPAEFEYTRDLEWAFFDRDYAAHRRYLRQGPQRLTPTGRMFLGFNNLGNVPVLNAIAAEAGLEVAVANRQLGNAGDMPVEFLLLELVPMAR